MDTLRLGSDFIPASTPEQLQWRYEQFQTKLSIIYTNATSAINLIPSEIIWARNGTVFQRMILHRCRKDLQGTRDAR